MHISYATAYSNAWFLIQSQSEIKAVGIIFATFGLISEPEQSCRNQWPSVDA